MLTRYHAATRDCRIRSGRVRPGDRAPSICLNMIVRNEAHIVHEVLDAVAPYLRVGDRGHGLRRRDPGDDPGPHGPLGIPGELYERPWHNFGHNRTEALKLAQGHGDYIWVMDADDMIVGSLDFSRLSADCYSLRYVRDRRHFWRPQVFRSGLRVRYEGVVHEYAVCDDPAPTRAWKVTTTSSIVAWAGATRSGQEVRARSRSVAGRGRAQPQGRALGVLSGAELLRPRRSGNARQVVPRRAEMGGWEEEVYYSMYRCGVQAKLGEPWSDIQDAYLRAWEVRPVRAEPLHAIANRYRIDGATDSVTCSPSAPPKSRFPKRTHCSFARMSMRGARSMSRRCAPTGSASMPRLHAVP